MKLAPMAAGLLLSGSVALPASESSDDALRAVDEQQRRMVALADVAGLERLAHPNLRINAPVGRVLGREEFLAMIRSGQIGAERFERVTEAVAISGNSGIVMGRETFTPTASSELGRIYGAVPLERRYTNVFLLENGQWLWLARHANVVPAR